MFQESSIELDRKYYADSYDYKGGQDGNEEPYTFSDGVGKMSMRMAKQLASDMKLDNCVPSCWQVCLVDLLCLGLLYSSTV